MKKIFILLFGLFLLTPLYAQDSSEGIKTWVEEEDGSPSIIVYKLKVGNSELTDNADGTASLAGGSGDITTVGDITSGAAFDGTQGNTLTFKGATSGTTALKPTAIAGTTTITLPAETGTACTTGSVCSGYQASGAVTSVTGTSPITSSGGVTPAIGIPKGNSTTDGYINATDWTTFNDKLNTTLASANIYVGNATNITTAVAMSGDVAIDNAGATTIQANSVALGTDTTNNYVATVADSGAAEVTVSGSGSETAAVTLAIASGITRDTEWDTWTEHPTLLSTQILVGNATNVTTNVTVSGDGLLSNTGALTVNDDSHAHTSTTLPATVSYLGSTINETEMSFSNITTLNANTTQHGFMPYLNNNASTFMDGTGNWTAASVSPAGSNTQIQYNNNSALGASSSLTFTPSTEDSYTKFLAHTDGTDGSTTFTDEAGIAITANGNAQIDTAQSKFGGASGLLDGTGDYLTTPDSDNYNFGSGDFSVDFQVRFNSVASNQDFIAHWTDGSTHSWEIFWTTSNVITFRYATTPTGQIDITFAWTPSTNTWYHIEVTRNGNNLYVFVDGTQVGSTADLTGVTLNNSTGSLYVGRRSDGAREFNGWLDEIRISKGIARHTTNFTAPTSAYVYATGLYVNGRIGIATAPNTTFDILTEDNLVGQTIKINATQASVTAVDTFIDFRSTTGSEGSIAGTASAGVIAYNTFTGSHYTQVTDKVGLETNMLLEIVDEDILSTDWNNEQIKYTEKEKLKDANGKDLKDADGKFLTRNVEKIRIIKHQASPKPQLFKTRICQTKNSPTAIGVYGGTDRENRDLVLSIGTGFIWAANKGVNIGVGDLMVSSDLPGCAELQGDGIVKNISVAKATESVTWKIGEMKRLIRVIYLGG